MNVVLLDTLTQVLGSQLSPGAVQAWNTLLNTMVAVVSKEIERLDEDAAILMAAKINARKANPVSNTQ